MRAASGNVGGSEKAVVTPYGPYTIRSVEDRIMSEQSTPAPAVEQVEYRDVPLFLGYRVGSDGSVWTRRHPRGKGRLYPNWRRLKAAPGDNGYLLVSLHRNGKGHSLRVHVLVMLCFAGPRPDGLDVRHLNGHRTDCRLSNLAYGTRQQNCADAAAHGTKSRGERHPDAKLTAEIVRSVRSEYAAGGVLQRELAERHGVHQTKISSIIRRQSWKHVK